MSNFVFLLYEKKICVEREKNFIRISFFWTIISWKINGIVDSLSFLGPNLI